jgi:5-methylcytosine-specific restriction protein B
LEIILGVSKEELEAKIKGTDEYKKLIEESKTDKNQENENEILRPAMRAVFDKYVANEQIVFTTFHQSMSYEDFIEGIKPKPSSEFYNYTEIKDEKNNLIQAQKNNVSYNVEDGIFKRLCGTAVKNNENKYILIIDEINRGNVSQIFGELITLIEKDKRIGADEELRVILPYSGDKFGVPSNLYIIGTMNTADRSVEALDTALRRRFSFEEMMPNPELIKEVWPENKGIEKTDWVEPKIKDINLVTLMKTINDRIEMLLDRDHLIGHSYFMGINDEEGLKNTFKDKIIPLLQEYFYGDYGKIGLVLGKGFVKVDENKNTKADSIFADFTYESSDDLIKPIYELLIDQPKFEIISAIQKLL